ncbi:MAG TPA: hypothetical protein VFW87_02550, partial [Pirellulales bacterium]|nr:hypothetical protein [Pirellulales bacterium]
MAIDPYSVCPGGTGKKIKFCCPDLVHELDKIQQMLSADQRQACLDYITQVEAKCPGRACLQTAKVLVQASLGQSAEARQAADTLLESQPNNPVALASLAMASVDHEGPAAAVTPLHQALAAVSEEIPDRVEQALQLVAAGLLANDWPLAGLAHTVLLLQIDPESPSATELMLHAQFDRATPLPLRTTWSFDTAPATAPWKAEFEEAVGVADRGHWLSAAERLAELSQRQPEAPAVWRTLGLLWAYLADNERAAEALARYASLAVPLDDAVDAEMLAQSLDPRVVGAVVDRVRIPYPISDFEEVSARLSASRQVLPMPPSAVTWADPDQPPPRSVFSLLDRAMPESGVGLTLDAAAEVLGEVLLFGRQTDREPRLEILAFRHQLEEATAAARGLVGQWMNAAEPEINAGGIPAAGASLMLRLHLPPDTPPETALAVRAGGLQRALQERWSRAPHPALGGASPQQAAGDPGRQVKVLAAIALMELAVQSEFDFNALRSRLGLPLPQPIDPRKIALGELPVTRLHRIDFATASDEVLAAIHRRAAYFRHSLAQRRLAEELVRRPAADAELRIDAHSLLASSESDVQKSFDHLAEARRLAVSAGKSAASLDLQELALRLRRGDAVEAERLMRHITAAYGRDQEVMSQFAQLLYALGLIDEYGQPVRSAAHGEPAELVAAGAAEPGKIWTPGGEAAP